MISKIIPTGGSFSNTSRYVCQKQECAQVIDSSGVRVHDATLMAKDFEGQREMAPDKRKAVFHGILSFHPREDPSNGLMVEIARKYLDRLGMEDTQYVIIRHTDTAHPHLHIVSTFVNNKGEIIREGLNRNRGIVIARQLTGEYKLIPYLKKNLALIHRENLRGADVKKYEIYEAITESLLHCRTLEDVEKRLLMKGINTRYRHDLKTGKRVGISFKIGKIAFKGSSIDHEFSFQRLERVLEERQRLELSQQLKQEQSQEQRQAPKLRLRLDL